MAVSPIVDTPTIFHPDLLRGRTALVTGGGSGLGRAIATGLAAAGADVTIAARREERLREAAVGIEQATGRTVGVDLVDIRDLDTVNALADRHGDVDILVNNAGGQFPQKARDFSPNGWRSVIDLNLNGTWNMTQAFGSRMLDGAGGTICQIIATVGRGVPGIAHSAAARAGVLELTRTLAYEWGPSVRLNCVAPGQFHTEGWDATYDEGVGAGYVEQPLPHVGEAADIAHAVTFLVSPAARFISGEVLFVDGGLILQGPMSALPPGGYPERERPRHM
ncbi:MAG: SDR family oxidoreductase [Ilumatobacteraceae bacterium]|jgi:citronellol/citronellal dehydrogenase|nr:SDR family oxidoreductase [Ilumatobacteraceae bacterium]